MRAFLSYATPDRAIAGEVRELLRRFEVESFMAHEDIEVSEEWRVELLAQLRQADVFVAILSQRYWQSIWCIQESGIAASRKMCFVPLSIDGSLPQGFMGHIQSTRVVPGAIGMSNLVPGLAKKDFAFTFERLGHYVGEAASYRDAEARFSLAQPLFRRANDEQMLRFLTIAGENGEVVYAHLCVKDYLPPLLRTYGARLDEVTKASYRRTIDIPELAPDRADHERDLG